MSFINKFDATINNPIEHTAYVHCFLLTINSNKAYSTYEEANIAKKELINTLREMMEYFDEFIRIYKSKKTRQTANVDFESIADDLSVHTGIEIGSVMHRVHAHLILRWITHDEYFFQLSLDKIRQFLKNSGVSYHVDVKFIKSDDDVKRYINN